jgi:acetyl-CoA carboxylase carboxyltransferase component
MEEKSIMDKGHQVREKNTLTAEARIRLLFDEGRFESFFPFRKGNCTHFGLDQKDVGNEGVITGAGLIHGRRAWSFSNDALVMGASMGEAQGDKICQTIDLAVKTGVPIIGLSEASGARIQEGVAALNAYCTVFGKTSAASGWIPQISVILGSCAGGTAYAAGLTDFIIMVEGKARLFITGPSVIRAVTGEEVTLEALGGSAVHGATTGLSHFVAQTEEEAIGLARSLLSFLPQNSKEAPPSYLNADPPARETPEIKAAIPSNPNRAFDMKSVILPILDRADFLEVQARFAQNMLVGFGRIDGKTVGVVANQPRVLAGCIDIDASWKAARFVRFCDAFNIPILTFADCPGYLPGVLQEHRGIIRNGSKLLFAYSEATVPKITVIVRKDYGGAYSAMCGKGMGADIVFALPTAELAVMGAEGAVNIIHRKEIENAVDPVQTRQALVRHYAETFLNPRRGAEYGIVDDIIEPRYLRKQIASSLALLEGKQAVHPYKKHSNIPL